MAMNRRTFYLTFIYGLWALIGAILAIPATIYLLLPPRPRKEREWVEAGNLSQLQPEVPEEWVFRRNREDGERLRVNGYCVGAQEKINPGSGGFRTAKASSGLCIPLESP